MHKNSIACFECKKAIHLKYLCPKFNKKEENMKRRLRKKSHRNEKKVDEFIMGKVLFDDLFTYLGPLRTTELP